ncbi:helix-turn-helix domain-containing protein [Rathayibacter sp. VKM Ac-2857]|uniref:helix-turn-helix domain-containing protein n=1 Tax=Rathayibacter sp. VKM Ac-2857 TaxID=2739020 RepID=UPI00156513AE|nr:helix-turn-helix transcriptional regulator [Rathayibacter sp. VKM Ac-2857]NQX17988.1 helix-turn-helix domain-containing protein [Rathayibacter sp. VKM Ac-2857]
METAAEIREFLTTRRARLTPAEAGLPDYGGRRRVPGLRREEVALLAGMSVEYYVRFERGNAIGLSPDILTGISRALRLDAAEHAHLLALVRAATEGAHPGRRTSVPRAREVGVGVRRLLDAMTGVPALVQNGRMDVLAINSLGRALFSEMYGQAAGPVNFAHFLFLEERSRVFYRDWDESAEQLVSLLRAESGRSPRDRALAALLDELAAGSDVFRALWAAHDVKEHRTGSKRFHHPAVGDLDLSFEALQLSEDPGLLFLGWTAEPGTSSDDALRLLASAATSTAPSLSA